MELYVATVVAREAAKSRDIRREAVRNLGFLGEDALPWQSVIFPAKHDRDAKARAKSILNQTGAGSIVYLAKLDKVGTFEVSINETPA